MDVEALEQAALAAVAAAASTDEIEAVRVEYLGRKSALKLALREVRDRETGMTLNAVRERIETAVAAREAELVRAELDRRLSEERADVTLPVGGYRRGHLHLITQIRREVEDVFLGLGYRVVDGREVETTHYNFDGLNFPPGPPGALAARDASSSTTTRCSARRRRRRRSARWRPQQPPVYIVSLGRVYRRDTPDATHTPIFHQVEGLAVDEGITLADLHGHARLPDEGAVRPGAAHRVPDALLPVHRAVDRAVRLLPRLRRRGLPGLPPLRAGSSSAAPGWSTRRSSSSSATTPSATRASRSGWGLERIAMLRHEFPDLRELWRNDLRFSRQF